MITFYASANDGSICKCYMSKNSIHATEEEKENKATFRKRLHHKRNSKMTKQERKQFESFARKEIMELSEHHVIILYCKSKAFCCIKDAKIVIDEVNKTVNIIAFGLPYMGEGKELSDVHKADFIRFRLEAVNEDDEPTDLIIRCPESLITGPNYNPFVDLTFQYQ